MLLKKFLSGLSILGHQYSSFLFLIQLGRYKRPSVVDFYFQDAKFKDITTSLPSSTMLLILFGELLSRLVNLGSEWPVLMLFIQDSCVLWEVFGAPVYHIHIPIRKSWLTGEKNGGRTFHARWNGYPC